MKKWESERHQDFQEDMEDAGYEVREYRGRFYYHGPAVSCGMDEFQNVLSATEADCLWDDLGLGKIVYPRD